jgi:Bacterial protein of unknown function (DUF899)
MEVRWVAALESGRHHARRVRVTAPGRPVRGCRSSVTRPLKGESKKARRTRWITPRVVTPREWLAARKDLLAWEKEATRDKDAVDTARRSLPMTEVTKDYTFTGGGG